MPDRLPRPNRERLSALTALTLLAYGMVRMVVLPSVETELSFLGLMVTLEFRTHTAMLALTAALAAAGSDWLIRDHPKSQGRPVPETWVIPGLAAVALGAIVIRIPESPFLLLGLLCSALLLVAILSAEFVVFDRQDPRRGPVSAGLYALALLLLAGTLFTIDGIGLRVIFATPAVFLSTTVVSWRLLRLSNPARTTGLWGSMVGLITAQFAVGLHYWPLPPLRVGLLLCLIAYLTHQTVSAHLRHDLGIGMALEGVLVGATGLAAILLLT